MNQTAITNNGTITANQSAGLTVAPSATGFTNNGTIQAAGAGALTLSGGPFTNTSGSILLAAGTTGTDSAVVTGGVVTLTGNATLNLSNGTVHGGTLTNSSTGHIVSVAGTSTLGGTVNNVAGGQIAVNNSTVLDLESTGTFTNNGTIALNSTNGNTDLAMIGGGTVTLGGSGTLTMSNNANNRIYGVSSTALAIGANQLVQGAGQIGIAQTAITNNGTITANQSAGMIISPGAGGFTNTNLVQATSGAILTLGGVTTNTGGTIQAVGTGSNVKLSGATVNGGTLASSGGGLVEDISNSTLNGITNLGTIQTDNGVITSLQGTITNSGLMTLNSSGSISDLALTGGGTVTLSGTGTITMSNNVNNRIYGNSTALVIGANQLIQGAGQIGVNQTVITNNGTITANQSAGLTLTPSSPTGFTNNGTIQTAGAGALTLSGGPFTNTSGSILLAAGTTGTDSAVVSGGGVTLTGNATLNLANGTIHGGEILTNSTTGNIVAAAGTNDTLGGTVNNVAGGQIAVNNSTVLNLESSGSFTNNGSISLNSSGSISDLSLIGGGTVTLGGSGTLTMSNNVNNRIYGGNTTSLVLGAGQIVQGAGNIGVGQTTFTNNGTIIANQPAGMTIAPNATGFTNNGTIQTAGRCADPVRRSLHQYQWKHSDRRRDNGNRQPRSSAAAASP